MRLRPGALSRRGLLGRAGAVLGLGALGALATACQPAPPAATPQAKVAQQPAAPVEKIVTQVVERVVTATPAAAPQAATKAVELKLSTDWNSPTRKAVLDLMKTEFEKANQNVKIEHWHMGSGGTSGPGGYTDIIVAQLLTGTAADVIGNFNFGPYLNQLADLTNDAPAAGWKKDQMIYDKPNQEFGGALYMLSMSASVGTWAYNKTIFKQAGVAEPTPAWTLDNVFEVATKLTDPGKKQYGVFTRPAGPQFSWIPHMWAAGAGMLTDNTAEVFDAAKKKTRLGEAGAPELFQWWNDLIHKHKLSPAPGEVAGLASGGVSDPFAAGKIAMMPFPGYQSGDTARQIGDRFEWSLMAMPLDTRTGKRAYDLHSEGWVIPKATQNRGTYATALKYALSFYTDPVQREVAVQGATLPVVRKWAASPEFTKGPPAGLDWVGKTADDPKVIVGDLQRRHKAFGPWYAALRREIERAFTGDVPAKDALAAAVKAGDEELAKNA
jgi:ABC-type glycerol-3-phosphate transport system substrate-binding protein